MTSRKVTARVSAKKLPLYEVDFHDVTVAQGWTDPEEAARTEPAVGQTVGYLVSKDESFWRLATMAIEDFAGVADITVIPTPMVIRSRRLK